MDERELHFLTKAQIVAYQIRSGEAAEVIVGSFVVAVVLLILFGGIS